MTLPGTRIVQSEASPSPRTAPTDTGTWFVAGFSEKGPIAPTLVRSLASFQTIFGARLSYSQILSDAAETFFREGGSRLYVARVTGPDPVIGAAKLYDAAGSTDADVALDVSGKSYGDWANALNVEVTDGDDGGFIITVTSDDVEDALETSPELADRDEAVAWAESSPYIDIALGVSDENPRAQGPTDVDNGDDDHGNAGDEEWAAALERFGSDLGPGQVSMPGRTTDSAHADTADHAATHNRVALLDAPDTDDVGELTDAADDARSAISEDEGARGASLWAPWAVIPGVVAATTRVVPYSAVQAGLIARSDASKSPNVAAAGDNGQARYAIGLSQDGFSDADRETLNEAGVDVALVRYGTVTSFGYRSLTGPLDTAHWKQWTGARLNMAVKAVSNVVGDHYLFAQLDGRRQKIGEFGGALTGELLRFYEAGSFFGETPDEAFTVDVGEAVNTVETIAEGQLRALIAYRASPFAEVVEILIVKKPITEGV